ncbi:MAG TPA: ACT domain-containing protein [Marinobacterium sp.]|nr:ACT domain-containing protein [Marinobacterium sp.]
MTNLVVTFMADDKPGIVNLLSKTVSAHEGNWLDSSLSRLGGKFTGIVVVQLPEDKTGDLTEALSELKQSGIHVYSEVSEAPEDSNSYKEVVLDLVGHDKPGIVRDISAVLTQHQVNVVKLTTELVPGSMSSELLFKAQGKVLVPQGADIDGLQDALEAIASDLLVDISFK